MMMTTTEWANKIIRTLEEKANHLPPCYSSWQEYLWDFWPDFPWTNPEFTDVLEEVLKNKDKLKTVCDSIQKNHNFDMMKEILKAKNLTD